MPNITSITINGNKLEIPNLEKTLTNISLSTTTSSGEHNIDMSEYFPDDGYVYEVGLYYWISGSVGIRTSKETQRWLAYNTNNVTGTASLHVGLDRKIILNISSANNCNISMIYYRKLYKD